MLEVDDLKVTGSPEEAVAFKGTVGPNSRLGMGGKLIVWVVNSGSGFGAGKSPKAGDIGRPFFNAGAGSAVSLSPFGSLILSGVFTTPGAGAGAGDGAALAFLFLPLPVSWPTPNSSRALKSPLCDCA